MTIYGLTLKLLANALGLIAAFYTVKWFSPDFANAGLLFGMWVGMAVAHSTYIGFVKEGQ